MPFYTFKCTKCNVSKDELVRIGTESTTCANAERPPSSNRASGSARTDFPNGANFQ
jgi:hypothetical protein